MKQTEKYVGIISSNPTEGKYYTRYLLQVKEIKDKKCNITVYIKIKGKSDLKYGDEIIFEGEYEEPDTKRNENGFDYEQYLKSNRNCSE